MGDDDDTMTPDDEIEWEAWLDRQGERWLATPEGQDDLRRGAERLFTENKALRTEVEAWREIGRVLAADGIWLSEHYTLQQKARTLLDTD